MIAEALHTHSSKRVMLGRGIHTLIRHVSFPSPTNVGHYNPPPKGVQRPRWHIDPVSGSDTICNSLDHPLARYCPLWHTRPHGFAFDDRDASRSPPHSLVKTRHVRERYPHPYKACFVPLSNRCGPYNDVRPRTFEKSYYDQVSNHIVIYSLNFRNYFLKDN